MNRFKKWFAVTLLALTALVMFNGCALVFDAYMLAPLQFAKPGVDYTHDTAAFRQRNADYYDCILRDNSSWDVIAACMAERGYGPAPRG